ncbi:MAG: hypothetical protein JWO46_2999 [Nocardioidaceae bacterium]|nr:hypothetical protein [Nocardioidaceae bacterium]
MLVQPTVRLVALAVLALALAGCGGKDAVDGGGPDVSPVVGACRVLTPALTAQPSNTTAPVACTKTHTAETFLTGAFPADVAAAGYDSPGLGSYVYGVCQPAFATWLGGDESIAMRTVLSWSWFRPGKDAWKSAKEHTFRCDVIGAPNSALARTPTTYRALPRTTKGMLAAAPPDGYMLCARGQQVTGSPKVACAEPHDWRAVTTVKLGQPTDPYPGDRLAQIRSQEFCSDSVGGWLGYPSTNYDYGVTVFHEAEWKAGNRRSICWARTTS